MEKGGAADTEEDDARRPRRKPMRARRACEVCGGYCVDHWGEEALREAIYQRSTRDGSSPKRGVGK